ncbi:MAG: glycogen debranching protein GlgX [Deltaproteobacteria bacterium]|nr:glycogen debranching protein GlgX [Deltaproteobacteria bacterium]
MEVWPGTRSPLGATYDGGGTNFALYSSLATKVELCLFDASGVETRVALPEHTGFIHHGYLPGVRPGQRYAFRVHGPHRPEAGELCDPTRLLFDPYAKAMDGHSVVINPYFDWGSDQAPRTPWHETSIYEAHVVGQTKLHPDVPAKLRGTYAGLAHPAMTDYLRELGVTALELLPVHEHVHEPRLRALGLTNYWGYSSIGFFAPHHEYASGAPDGQQVQEFKLMVKALHRAGLELILDVVYNHTGEGGPDAPAICFRGIDNPSYYRLADDRRHYVDYTGCGNSLNVGNPHVMQLIMDSLRYWVTEMHVDGFRFDLASALARQLHAVDKLSTFFQVIQQDPVINRVKLIAEPWDLGDGGYQVGEFPVDWSEWNGKYRDAVRSFWRGDAGLVPELARRLSGSADLYADDGRRPWASINFVTSHDGFTLRDLGSYERKHNQANGEDGRDGTDDNRSQNHGVEGETTDPAILDARARKRRCHLATLLLSQGVPMLLAGDELGRTQGGNNNAYCQDNRISWTDWENADAELRAFVRGLLSFRRAHPSFSRRRWLIGRGEGSSDVLREQDAVWFHPSGERMGDAAWHDGGLSTLALYLNGERLESHDSRGRPVRDDSFFLIFHAGGETTEQVLPPALADFDFHQVLDTSAPTAELTPADEKSTSPIALTEPCVRVFLLRPRSADASSDQPQG